jgi:nicotinate-nucleotide adenylyltransferase
LNGFPVALPGQRVGLLGGSFNPPHPGHRATSLLALKRLRLDAVWWLVTPGNPLKDTRGLPPLDERLSAARRVARHPRLIPTGIEARLRTRYTVDTLRALCRRYPGVRFVWLMGADNLRQFHRWKGWRAIARLMPMAVIDRPGSGLKATQSRAALALARYRIDGTDGPLLAGLTPPRWIFLHGLKSPLSSTALRAVR